MTLQQALKDVKKLSKKERAELAHSLLTSLEEDQDEGVDQAWLELAEHRLQELDVGNVEAVSWASIKRNLKA